MMYFYDHMRKKRRIEQKRTRIEKNKDKKIRIKKNRP